MKNVMRGLIFEEQVSLTLIDCTKLVKEGLFLQGFQGEKGTLFAKALCFGAFMSACLKEKRGEVSLVVKADCGSITVSGNYDMYVRGCFDFVDGYPFEKGFGQGTLTIVRDDGYARPFVGSCELLEGVDDSFAEYFRISEQLPTEIATTVEYNEAGEVEFAAIVAVQPLPFADEKTLAKMPQGEGLKAILDKMKKQSLKEIADGFLTTTISEKEVVYKCHCSREYLKEVLVSVGERQMRKIIDEDGALRVHCHYCNTDYSFDHKDADEMFKKA